ncbi:hypothetical protein [Cryobacterium sp. CG_9.6]|uniref:hypothetical protein n=1 Tax=Cryobacterium sp. CG_9.6 TaxID=2760710 RepID=UPI00247562CD|nr:hypothetical protein [Cryobacterium sp. CG_9.6]MDH6236299.1 hypothetical protein [Cryobacterium sp. CG_9.6]
MGWLIGAMWAFLVAYTVVLLLPDQASARAAEGWLYTITDWLPVAVCGVAVFRTRGRHLAVLLATAAVTSFALGDSYYLLAMTAGGELPFPSAADAGYLLFYVLIVAAVVTVIYREIRTLARHVLLDGWVGAFGAATFLAVVLNPTLNSAIGEPISLGTAISVAYPLFDLILVAIVAGLATVLGVRLGRGWAPLVGAFVAFAAADVRACLLMLPGLSDRLNPCLVLPCCLTVSGLASSR